MNNDSRIDNLGEINLIKIIEELVFKKTGKDLVSDDSFFFNLEDEKRGEFLVLNSDMLVSSTDVPPHMSFYQIGRKSVIMNLSDLLVKGVEPRGLIISLGLPKELERGEFIDIIKGIIDSSLEFDFEYIGGDTNETKELIINPTVFGSKMRSGIIYRKGINVGDILTTNGKFGLTGVGFDILLKRGGDVEGFPKFKRSIMSVLEPKISGMEALLLSDMQLATSSIDSSDGLSKLLLDLMKSNPNLGFEINYNDNLIDPEARLYSQEFNIPLEDLVFNAGEEYIHFFTIPVNKFSKANKVIQAHGGRLFKIGKVISEENIFILKENIRSELKSNGYEHFSK
ncbi:MAG: thiamine-phosphate kinase [Promethearchaeota archaeon]|jgi:thiamine-monophosphate kinase